MNFRSRLTLLLGLAAALSASAAAATKPFTPELMLQNEGVGEVRFSADGSRLYFDRLLPYREKRLFSLGSDWNRSLSVLNMAQVAGGEARPLRSVEQDRTWLLDTSPDGRHLLFGWFDGDVQRLGLLDQQTGQERRLTAAGSTGPGSGSVHWLSDEVLVTESRDAAEQMRLMGFGAFEAQQIARWAEQSWKGSAPSVKVVGSGRYTSKPNEMPITVIRVDAATGRVQTLDQGTITSRFVAAPAGGRIAWLLKKGAFDMAGAKVKSIGGLESINELVVYDLARGRSVVPACDGCSVSAGTLRWSPSGNQLYFSARKREGHGFVHRHFVYDARSRQVSPFRIKGLPFDTEEDVHVATLMAPLLWLDDKHLAVRSRNVDAKQFEDQGYRWHLARRDGTVLRELTTELPRGDDKHAFDAPVAVYRGALLMLADGQLWRLPQQGKASRLTAALGAQVESWCAPYGPWHGVRPKCDALNTDNVIPPIDAAALRQGRLVLRLMKDETFTGEFVFLDLETGQARRVKRPTDDSEPLEASAVAEAAVFQRKGSDGDEVILVGADGSRRSLYAFNRHLAGVQTAKQVLLTRREAGEDEDRNDWLLLPPDHKAGQRLPLLVYFYPDTRYSKELHGDDLREVSFLNKNLAVARGYAVLLASMKISDFGTPDGNPMREMHEQLIRAAENAVAQGYVDPERWAITGHSYGGYGTNSVITQTDRFRAAISLAGPANLTSAYAIGMHTTKATMVPEGLNFGAGWSEGGQGRMGVPPWENPQRYIDNSPLFSAHRVTTPLMLAHGDVDFVNVNEAEQLFTALHRQGKDVQLVRYWGEGHNIESPANIADLWQRIFAFLEEQLGPPSDAR